MPAASTTLPQRTISDFTKPCISATDLVSIGSRLSLSNLLLDLGLGENGLQLAVQLVDHRGRRLAGRHHHEPGRHVVAGHAGLVDRRNVLVGRNARGGGDAERSDLAALEHRLRRGEVAEHEVDVSGDDVVQRRHAAAIDDVGRLHAGHGLEQLGEQMVRRARPGGAERQLALLFLGVGDELRHGFHRHRSD